jgi:predicted CoA-binding protein
MSTSLTDVNDFISQRTLAIVGVSRSGKKIGNAIYKSLKETGYKVFQVHPQAEMIEGDRCFAGLENLPEKVGGLVVCLPPAQTEIVLHQVLAAGITRVWLQPGAESYAAMRFCENHGIKVIHGQCLLMFLEPVKSIHRFHRWAWKLIGKYPSATSSGI